jgi:pimeloyl-ACP methyl ester carboxylesterase
MKLKNLTAALFCALLFGLSSCKKDFVSEETSINGEVTSDNVTANEELETAPAVHTPRQIAINSNVSGFWESLPARYNLTTKRYPLIVFIHGIGELGTGLSRVNCCGLPKHLANKTFPAKFLVNGVYYSFIVISPQFRVRPSSAQVQSVIDYAKNRYRVDASRVYVTGLSMGGGSTWDYAAVYGQSAAAIVPVCGGTAPTTTLASKVASKNLPIWTLSSSADKIVPISWARNWISWIDARNATYAPKTKLTVYTYETHNGTWARAFNPTQRIDGRNIYEWMLLHRRGTTTTSPAPTTSTGNKLPIARAGADQTIPISWKYMPFLNGTTSTDPDGWIRAFKWTKISGPSSYWFSSSTSGQTKANGLVAGTYVFRLTVTDNKGATSYDDVKVTMTASGTGSTSTTGAPIAIAGPDQTIPKSWNYSPYLNGTRSYDPGGWISKFKWTKISGPTGSWFYPNSMIGQPKISGLTVGTHVFRLTVTDNSGKTDTDDVVITITNS